MKAINACLRWIARYMLVFISLLALSIHQNCHSRTLTASTLIYPPYEYLEQDKAKGMAVEIIRQTLLEAGEHQVKFKFYPWKRAVKTVELGHSDILFNAGKNEARQQWGYYAESVLILQRYVLFKRKNDNIIFSTNYNGFEGLSIAIRRGYLYGEGPFRRALDSKKFNLISLTNSSEQSIDQLLKGRVDLFVGDLAPIMHVIKKRNLQHKIDIVQYQNGNKTVLVWPTYMLFSKKTVSPNFVIKINSALEEIKSDGRYEKIVNKYLKSDSNPN